MLSFTCTAPVLEASHRCTHTDVCACVDVCVQLIRESIEAPTSEKFLFVDLEPELLKSLELRILKEVRATCLYSYCVLKYLQVPH